jgi:AcrR family transcriptional regulator
MSNHSHRLLALLNRESAPLQPVITPRKQPRQQRAQVTHDAIVEAAAQVLAAGGLAQFNTNAVAARAGVSIGSLYQYFPNKDAVMVALIHRSQQRQLATFRQAALTTGTASLSAIVRALVRAAMQHHHDNALLASAIDYEEARLPLQADLNGYLMQSGQMIRALLIQHIEVLGNIDLDRAVMTLPTLVRAATDCWANLSPPQLDVAEDEAVRAVLGYLQLQDDASGLTKSS